jgi:hypothetical protein
MNVARGKNEFFIGPVRRNGAIRHATTIRSLVALSFIVALMTGCLATPMSVHQTANPQIDVSLLFEHDGCRVYRFVDVRPVYYTDCRGSAAWEQSCGRNCSYPVTVITTR